MGNIVSLKRWVDIIGGGKEVSRGGSLEGLVASDLAVGFGLVLDGAVAGDKVGRRVEQDLYLNDVDVGLVLQHFVVLALYGDLAYLVEFGQFQEREVAL